MYELIEFRHLRCFLAAAQEGNVTRAAQLLHVTQPSVSTAIQELEEEVSAQLFYRETWGVSLTPAGHSLVSPIEQLMKLRDQAFETAHAIDTGTIPPLYLGFSPFVDRSLVDLALASYSRLFPGSTIHPTSKCTAQLIELLMEGSVDAGFVMLPIERHGVIVQPLATEHMLICLREDDPIAKESAVPLQQASEKLRVSGDPKQHPKFFAHLVSQLSRFGVVFRPTHIGSTPSDMQWMVRQGMGYALMRESSLLDPDLTLRPIAGANIEVESGLVYRDTARSSQLLLLACEMKKARGNNGHARGRQRSSKMPHARRSGQMKLIA